MRSQRCESTKKGSNIPYFYLHLLTTWSSIERNKKNEVILMGSFSGPTSVYQDSIYYLQSGVFQALLQLFQGTSSPNEL